MAGPVAIGTDSQRRGLLITPTAYGDGNIRQRFYRRGGTLPDNWFYVGQNTGDGATLLDILSDLAIVAAGTVEIDHYQPVPTQDAAGNTILAQPVAAIFGPTNDGQLFAVGDPHRPGHLYACIAGEPDHWPPDQVVEVCAPSEELLNGCVLGAQPLVFSRARGFTIYPNLTGSLDGAPTAATVLPNGCTRGLAGRWALTVGYGAVWFVSSDGIYRMTGGPEQTISDLLWPLFHGQSAHGYAPIDFTQEAAIRLTCFKQELYVQWQDVNAARVVAVYQILTGHWRFYSFGQAPAVVTRDLAPGLELLIGGNATGKSYTHTGFSDDGAAIPVTVRTGAWDFGHPREEKLLGDQVLSCDRQGETLSLQNFLNMESVTNPVQPLDEGTGAVRAIFDSFGLVPQKAQNLTTEITWSSALAAPILYFLGTAITVQPEQTINRVTNWDDLGHPDQKYVTGVTFDCDTGNVARTIIIEGDLGGVITTVATLTVQTDGRHKVAFSWPAAMLNQVRIRPNDDCKAWMLFRADWIAQPEPPTIAGWDIYFENAWDSYYTGVDLYCDTQGQTKTLVVTADGVAVTNQETGGTTFPVTTTGRKVVHLTFIPGRAHVYHLYATDANPGRLYTHKWHLVEEPAETDNWNAAFTIYGTQADKWLKALVFEMDSFGLDKTVHVEIDGVLVETLTVNTTGRKVVQVALPAQHLGRVVRVIPTDANPSRLYTLRPVFDEEPFQLTRWETQELDHGQPGSFSLIEAMVTLKSTGPVTLTITNYVNQTGSTVVDSYVIPSTGGVKLKTYVPFLARRAFMVKYVLTAASAFWLYQEESSVMFQPTMGGQPELRRVWGNADVDTSREMVNATDAAARSGGGTA